MDQATAPPDERMSDVMPEAADTHLFSLQSDRVEDVSMNPPPSPELSNPLHHALSLGYSRQHHLPIVSDSDSESSSMTGSSKTSSLVFDPDNGFESDDDDENPWLRGLSAAAAIEEDFWKEAEA
ncbi:hypothetical protein AAF712_003203 [Marasmius tenuissimus]|uniref:Uncharacterized protein n=1 Tax=Marasmius tenuissimus TaxID=585030 RepID=A0ABR3A7Q7_9AGAR